MKNPASLDNTLLECPILFIVFNRPIVAEKVFLEIKNVKPRKLYIASDGPRTNNVTDVENIKRVREIVSAVDWPCEVRALFRESNLGCKYAVSEAISWFFSCEESGIILEDDCVPHRDFFFFCQELLEQYRDNGEIQAITGQNFQEGKLRGDGSYYFSIFNHIWGWASWRRAWNNYDPEIEFWPELKASRYWSNFCLDRPGFKEYWEKIFDKVYAGEIDTWDYQWMAHVWKNGGITITPNVNMISNIGFEESATHTKKKTDISNLPIFSIGDKVIHPNECRINLEADMYVFKKIYMHHKKLGLNGALNYLIKIIDKINKYIT